MRTHSCRTSVHCAFASVLRRTLFRGSPARAFRAEWRAPEVGVLAGEVVVEVDVLGEGDVEAHRRRFHGLGAEICAQQGVSPLGSLSVSSPRSARLGLPRRKPHPKGLRCLARGVRDRVGRPTALGSCCQGSLGFEPRANHIINYNSS